jgi:hypothetical protein
MLERKARHADCSEEERLNVGHPVLLARGTRLIASPLLLG